MNRTREQLESLEERTLAPFAQFSSQSAGRENPEPLHPWRLPYQRDRSRIIHSKAFRRLEAKTQVFRSGSGDHVRNRLTHTIEVASVSRSIARSLGLNEDLVEAIALAHDLGHSPFGHSGEETLDRLMKEHGGFEHNAQSLRVVRVLETRHPEIPGLNLSHEVLEGLRKHDKFHESPKGGEAHSCASLEAQIANLADEIAYYSHDIEDGLDFELISLEQLRSLEIWNEMESAVSDRIPDKDANALCVQVVRCLIDREVEDVVATSHAAIVQAGIERVEDVRAQAKPLIRYSAELLQMNRELRRFLYKNLYYHPRVKEGNQAACVLLEEVFGAYRENPELLGSQAAARIDAEGLERTICDYISGMTDLYLLSEHERLFPGSKRSRPPTDSSR